MLAPALISAISALLFSTTLAAQQQSGTSPSNNQQARPTSNSRYFWYSRDGRREAAFIEPGVYAQVELSPDNKLAVVERRNARLAVNDPNQRYDLWLANFSEMTFVRWTLSTDNPRDPVWAPDSRRIAYRVRSLENRELREVVVGSSKESVLDSSKFIKYPDDWTRDGKWLLYHTDAPDTVALLPMSGHEGTRVILDKPGGRNDMRVSPNGRWIAYGSNVNGAWEIYLASFPSFDRARQISNGGGVQVRWRRDGKELFYLTSDSKMLAQAIDPLAGKQIGSPRVLFQTAANPAPEVYLYSVTGDGKRFLIREGDQ